MQHLAKVFIFLALSAWAELNIVQADTCSYENCSKWKGDDFLNVHLVCHSHDDAGWLKTVDQYFWGSNLGTSPEGVQYIIESVTRELLHDPVKRFSYCESSFFWRWLLTRDNATRADVIKLVQNGQLEIIGGGWVQNDEAASHYLAVIDQMTTGHLFLNSTFGRCGAPRVAWQIDPFGHSREIASLFAQIGLESVFFARLDHHDKDKRLAEKNMEALWHGSDDLGASSDIIAHALYNHYSAPPGFCFDQQCGDDPVMDDKRLEEYNADQRGDDFISWVKGQAEHYQTNHILVTMGDDFDYMNAGRNFASIDRLIKNINDRQSQGSNVNVIYSTPACYTKAIKEAGIQLQPKSDDYFPYADSEHSYWTGYFTSRVSLKGSIRQANGVLQACQSLDAIAGLGSDDSADVNVLRQALGITQHHDAVTGTAKQHVTNDYVQMLHGGLLQCQQVFNDALGTLAPKSTLNPASPPYHTFCFNLNASTCNISQGSDQFVVTLYNGRAQPLNTYLRLPVPDQTYSVSDPQGKDVSAQVVKTFVTGQLTEKQGPSDLVFPVTVPGIGYSTYYVNKGTSTAKVPPRIVVVPKPGEVAQRSKDDYTLKNDFLTVEFDSDSGLVKTITDADSGQTVQVKQTFYWYRSATWGSGRASGAYIFRPADNNPTEVATKGQVSIEKVDGPLVQEIRQTFSDWVSQTIRLYKDKPYLELEWTVGPIPSDDNIGKEVISRFETSVANDGVFWTDANGRQLLNRTRNYRATFEYDNDEPVSGNYYPVNTRISIKDSNVQLTVLNDRSQGGSSVQDGYLELMLHRRIFEDDGLGVGEPLNEEVDGRGLVGRGKHWLLLSTPSKGAQLHRQYASELFYQPIPTFAPLSGTFDDYRKQFQTTTSGVNPDFPQNVNLLTLSQLDESTVLLRFEHPYQNGEDPDLATPVTVSLKDQLAAFDILKLEELSLSANTVLDNSVGDSIVLQPMQIRTFRGTVSNKLTSKRKLVRDRFFRFAHKARQ